MSRKTRKGLTPSVLNQAAAAKIIKTARSQIANLHLECNLICISTSSLLLSLQNLYFLKLCYYIKQSLVYAKY